MAADTDRLTAELDAIEQRQETGSLFDFATDDSPRLLKALRELLKAAGDWMTQQPGDSPLVAAAGHQVREIIARELLGEDSQ